MVLEKADVRDSLEILTIQKEAFQSEAIRYNDFTIAPLVQTVEELEEEFKSNTFIVVREKGKILGSIKVFVEDDTCFIGRVVVSPSRQGEGIGSLLMNRVEKEFSDVKRFELFTGSLSERNLAIYKNKGFAEFKREKITEDIEFIYLEKIQNLLSIRFIEKSDIPKCAELFVSVFTEEPWNEVWNIDVATERIIAYLDTPNSISQGAFHGDNLLGFLMGSHEPYQLQRSFFLKELCVAKDSQGKGVGTQLWSALEYELKKRSVDSINLLTMRNSAAEQFYKKQNCVISESIELLYKELK